MENFQSQDDSFYDLSETALQTSTSEATSILIFSLPISFMAEYSKSLTSVGIGTASSVHLLNLIMNHYPHGQRNCGGPSCRLVDTFDNLWCGCARCEIFTF